MPQQVATESGTTRQARRRIWVDPRFVIGVILVAASVAGVWFVVASNDETTPVYAAGSTLTAGSALTEDDLVVTRVRLGDLTDNYVRTGELPDGGALLSRTIPKGELIPVSAVTTASSVGVSPVVVDVSGVLAEQIETGSVVDVWAAEPVEAGGFGQPVVIVDGATVTRVVEGDGMVGDASVSVEVLVPKGDVATLLAAVANGHAISLVPRAVQT